MHFPDAVNILTKIIEHSKNNRNGTDLFSWVNAYETSQSGSDNTTITTALVTYKMTYHNVMQKPSNTSNFKSNRTSPAKPKRGPPDLNYVSPSLRRSSGIPLSIHSTPRSAAQFYNWHACHLQSPVNSGDLILFMIFLLRRNIWYEL